MFRNPPIRYIPIIRDWLQTYPPFTPYWVNPQNNFSDINNIHVGEFPTWALAKGSSAIQPTRITTIKKEMIAGNIVRTRKLLTMIFARVASSDDFTREDATNFNTDFLHWVEEQQDYGDAPKFGNVNRQFEIMEITGNFMWQPLTDTSGVAEYMWQLNITHQYKTVINN